MKHGTIYLAIKLAVLVILLLVVLWFIYNALYSVGLAEETEYTEAYVLCMPNDYVNVREKAAKKGIPIGYLEAGDKIYLDGKQKNGFLHCINLTFELSEGWIYKGYVVHDEPEFLNQDATIVSKGRLAARKFINGRRTRWLKPMATVKVYYWSDEWCVTNCGYLKSEYLELNGE